MVLAPTVNPSELNEVNSVVVVNSALVTEGLKYLLCPTTVFHNPAPEVPDLSCVQTRSGEKPKPLIVVDVPLPVHSDTSITVDGSSIVGVGRLAVLRALYPDGAE